MSIAFIRSFHHKRVPNYNGYWTQILNRAIDTIETPRNEKAPISIPIIEIHEPIQSAASLIRTPNIVHLKGKPLVLPEKPVPPDNCCMSGCAHCVWDLYQEDMDEYVQRKKELKSMFTEAGEPLPRELESTKNIDVMDEMDPTMKAFLLSDFELFSSRTKFY
ncbi:MAG: oxidoreductase-like protein [Benjaminiella poitrasii]|nr:MAG: oxidoreductase-like protein [Benjaminiella poitrasii]